MRASVCLGGVAMVLMLSLGVLGSRQIEATPVKMSDICQARGIFTHLEHRKVDITGLEGRQKSALNWLKSVMQPFDHHSGQIITQQSTSGLIRSYEYLSDMDGHGTSRQQNSYTYDQALALLVAVAEGDRVWADDLLRGLSHLQVRTGEFAGAFASSGEQHNPANVDKNYYTGGNAFALYALTRYVEAYGDQNNARYMLERGLQYISQVRTNNGPAEGLYEGGRSYTDDGGRKEIKWHSTEHNTDLWHVFERASRVLNRHDLKQKADDLATAIIAKLWNSSEERFNQGFNDDDYALDTTSWGAVFLAAVGEYDKAVKSAANAEAYKHASNRAIGYTPYINRTTTVPTVWYEGTYGVAHAHAALGNKAMFEQVTSQSMVGQRTSGGFPYADDEDMPNGRSRATSVASTSWFLLATKYPDGIWSECRAASVSSGSDKVAEPSKASKNSNLTSWIQTLVRMIKSGDWTGFYRVH